MQALEVATHFPPKTHVSNLSNTSLSDVLYMLETIPLRKSWFRSLHRNADSANVPKVLKILFLVVSRTPVPRQLQPRFCPSRSQSTALHSQKKLRLKTLLLWPLMQNPDGPKIPKVAISCFISKLKLNVRRNHLLDFFLQCLNRTL